MKKFIEIHDKQGKPHLLNIDVIIDICDHEIYVMDTRTFASDFSIIHCMESYEEIKRLLLD